jgi:Domain of unknown function (DUF4157)
MRNHSRTHTPRPDQKSSSLVQRKSTLRVGDKNDSCEREADRIAGLIVNGSTTGLSRSLSHIKILSPVQREDKAEPASDEEKYKEGAKKVGEAFLETELGKKLKAKLEEDKLVKGAKKIGESFIDSLAGKIITGATATGVVAALAATHSELPLQIPEIPLDVLTPGLKMKLTYEGPVDKPTNGMLTFSYTEQVATSPRPAESRADKQRAENARMAAGQAQFRAGMSYGPGTPEARQKQMEDDAWRRAAFSHVGRLPVLDTVSDFPGLPRQPAAYDFRLPELSYRPKPFRYLDPDLKLKRLGSMLPAADVEKKEEPDAPVQRKVKSGQPGPNVPAKVDRVISSAGQPLGAALRDRMEIRFGCDFSRVRIHTGRDAGESAAALNAHAYTAGEHIVFGAGQYSPHLHQGRHLLAHELAHVVQQTRPRATNVTIRRKVKNEPGVKSGTFYQYVIDTLASMDQTMDEERQRGKRFVFPPSRYSGMKALLELCKVVEQENMVEIPNRLKTYETEDVFFHLGTLTQTLMIELAARLFKLGMERESDSLRRTFARRSSYGPNYDPGASRRSVDYYTGLVALAISSADSSTPQKAGASLDVMIRAFVPLRDALITVDQDVLARERRNRPLMVLRPWISTVDFYDAVFEQIQTLYGGIESMFQALTETAASELESGSAAATLTLTDKCLEKKLRPILFPADTRKDISHLKLKITHTTIKKGRGKISDAFDKGQKSKKRTVQVTTYKPEQVYVKELYKSLESLYYARRKQVDLLTNLYGGPNVKVIQKLKGARLRLHNNDDWRQFVLEKYRSLAQPTGKQDKMSPAKALDAIFELLFDYLKAFTIHARYTNVYDIGDNYLNKDFPRALTGQLIHDCGVYALRVAYILSLVRQELKLRFRFVRLPAHLALVIDGDQLPTYVINNDHYKKIPTADWAKLYKDWQAFTEIKAEVSPSGDRGETQFTGELAGAIFIPGALNMPFIISQVPKAGGDANAAKAKLWATYQRESNKDLFGPASKDKRKGSAYLFHTRYMALTERMRKIHNEALVKAWNIDAPAAWAAFNKLLIGDGKRTTISSAELMGLLMSHDANYDRAMVQVISKFKAMNFEKESISRQIRKDPKLRRKGVRLGYGPRATTLWTYYWEGYRTRLKGYITRLEKQKENQIPLADVHTELKPPFIPIEKNRIDPLD